MMNGRLILILYALSSLTAAASTNDPELLELINMDIQSLGNINVTASRELTSTQHAPAVMTVITADEIKRRGYKTLKDVLDRVPGFFNSLDSSYSLISSRGYVQNPNTNYLMLVDGHAVNSTFDQGIGNTHLLPFLYQIKRIEIQRNPGSTLWGGDAANGIIHFITYDGDELAKDHAVFSQLNATYDFRTRRNIENALLGAKLGDEGSLMVSASRAESHAAFTDVFIAGTNAPILNRGAEGNLYKFEDYRPSYELQAKAKWRGFFIDGRLQRFNSFYNFLTYDRNNDQRNFKQDYLRFGYTGNLGAGFSLDANVYHNWYSVYATAYLPEGSSKLHSLFDGRYQETGVNAVLSYKGWTEHLLKLGIQYQNRDYQPMNRFFTGSGYYSESLAGLENSTGVFIEDEYSGIKDVRLTLGMRYQTNDLRQASENLLWRGAAIWQPVQHWTFKYLYNSGVLPTSMVRSRGTLERPVIINGQDNLGPTKPQLSGSHDLQAMYTDEQTRATLTLFKNTMQNFIARPSQRNNTGQKLANSIPIVVNETNLTDLSAYGIELEAEHRFTPQWLLYSNYAWAVNKANHLNDSANWGRGIIYYNLAESTHYFAPNRQMTGAPEHIWNIGVDWTPTPDYSVNLHYRGWTGAWGRIATQPNLGQFKSYGAEHYVDFNLLGKNIGVKGLDLSLYGKNILDNRSPMPSAPHGGYTFAIGREWGLSISYSYNGL